MSSQRIADRYARSLLFMATERSILPAVTVDVEQLVVLCASCRPFKLFLASPILSDLRKAAILDKLFGKHFHKLTMKFMALLARKGRAPYLEPCVKAYMQRYRIQQGVVEAELQLAASLSDAARRPFMNYVAAHTNCKPQLTMRLRPELLGGFILRIGHQQLDKSVSSQLSKLRKSLVHAAPTTSADA